MYKFEKKALVMEKRPVIKLVPSGLDRLMEISGMVVFAAMWILTIYVYIKLPAVIPVHFNANGEPDNYGNKLTLLILPVIGSIIYFGIGKLNQYPHIFNYLTPITEENAERQYTLATRMMRYLKLIILLIFFFILLFTYLTTTSAVKGLGPLFLPVIFILLLAPVAGAVVQAFRNPGKNKVEN